MKGERKDMEAEILQLQLKVQANNLEIEHLNEELELTIASKNEQLSQYLERIAGMCKKLQDLKEEKEIESAKLQERMKEVNKNKEDRIRDLELKIKDLEQQNSE